MKTNTATKGDKNASSNMELDVHTGGQCDICGGKGNDFRAVVVNGQFYPSVCGVCRSGGVAVPTDAKYQKSRAQEDFAKETIQPYTTEGKANPDFIIAYPDLKDMFTQEELSEV